MLAERNKVMNYVAFVVVLISVIVQIIGRGFNLFLHTASLHSINMEIISPEQLGHQANMVINIIAILPIILFIWTLILYVQKKNHPLIPFINTCVFAFASISIMSSGGGIEMHFSFFIVVGIIAFYREIKLVLLMSILFAIHHFITYLLLPEMIFNIADYPVTMFSTHVIALVFTTLFTCVQIHSTNHSEEIYFAHHDIITNLPNRLSFTKRLHKHLAEGSIGGIFFVDLDDFKSVNDEFGHSIGDSLLIEIGKKFSNKNLEINMCARIGGDEFLLIQIGSQQKLEETAKKLIDILNEPIKIGEIKIYTTASIGIATFPLDGQDENTLIKHADVAMYQAKKIGKNKFYFFDDDMLSNANRYNTIVNTLQNCIEKDEVFLVYQPEVDCHTNKVLALESLMRIKSEKLGFLSPAEFIPIAEASGYIVPLSYWALETACRFAKKMVDDHIDFGVISVNISSIQLMDKDFVTKTLDVLNTIGLEPKYLQIEITESILINQMGTSIQKLIELRNSGITVALDDFGTSYSSLSYLIDLPIDVLKIDKSFVTEISSSDRKQILSKTIIDMSHSLGLKVVAEGVEYESEKLLLKEQSCDLFQGYFFSHPISEIAMLNLLTTPSK